MGPESAIAGVLENGCNGGQLLPLGAILSTNPAVRPSAEIRFMHQMSPRVTLKSDAGGQPVAQIGRMTGTLSGRGRHQCDACRRRGARRGGGRAHTAAEAEWPSRGSAAPPRSGVGGPRSFAVSSRPAAAAQPMYTAPRLRASRCGGGAQWCRWWCWYRRAATQRVQCDVEMVLLTMFLAMVAIMVLVMFVVVVLMGALEPGL